jgi:hypothetical protein
MRTPESGVHDADVADVAGGGPEGRIRLPRVTGPRAFTWPAVITAAAIVLFLCYLRLSMTQRVTSDGASNALQAWDMLHGNPLLRGWTLTDVSFYTTELPQYMGVELVRGLGPDVVHTAAAMSYTLLVLLAGYLAKGRATGREGLVRFGIAAGIMLAPQPGTGALILLLAPDHLGTQIPILVIWLVLDRAPRRAWVPVLIGLLLTWVQVGDRITLIVAVVPLTLACAVRAFHGPAVRRESLRSRWYELSLAAAALLSVPVASLAVKLIRSSGGYSLQAVNTTVSSVHALPSHSWVMVQGVLALFGADFVHLPLGIDALIAVLHLVGLALAVVAVGIGIRRFLVSDLLVAVLTVAVLLNLAGYVVSTLAVTNWSTRQIAGVLPAGAVLAGRLLAGRLLADRVSAVRLVRLLAAVLLCYAAALGYGMTKPTEPAVGQNLAGWLSSHHLSYGLSGYGFGNTTTLASGGHVALRSATWLPAKVAPGPEEFQLSWYDKRLHYANFVVMAVVPGKFDPMTYPEVRRIFGAPARTYHFGQFIIMTWNKNLLNELG